LTTITIVKWEKNNKKHNKKLELYLQRGLVIIENEILGDGEMSKNVPVVWK